MNRRSFLTAMLAAGAAPYVMSGGIGRGVLMPVRDTACPPISLRTSPADEVIVSGIVYLDGYIFVNNPNRKIICGDAQFTEWWLAT